MREETFKSQNYELHAIVLNMRLIWEEPEITTIVIDARRANHERKSVELKTMQAYG